MQTDPNFQDPLALVAEGSADFKMVGPKQSSVYITVENISVYIKRDDEGVSVDLFALGHEMEHSLAGTWATYDDAKDEESEGAPSRQQLLDWNVSWLSADLQSQGFVAMDLDELLHEFVGGPRASAINNEGLFGQLSALLEMHFEDAGQDLLKGWQGLMTCLKRLDGFEARRAFTEQLPAASEAVRENGQSAAESAGPAELQPPVGQRPQSHNLVLVYGDHLENFSDEAAAVAFIEKRLPRHGMDALPDRAFWEDQGCKELASVEFVVKDGRVSVFCAATEVDSDDAAWNGSDGHGA